MVWTVAQVSLNYGHLYMHVGKYQHVCAYNCQQLTQAASADHVWWYRPELPLSLDVLQQSLVEAPRTHRVGFQFAGCDLTWQPHKRAILFHTAAERGNVFWLHQVIGQFGYLLMLSLSLQIRHYVLSFTTITWHLLWLPVYSDNWTVFPTRLNMDDN